jgi:hypothetical protein
VGRSTCIGATADPFGHATVHVLMTDGKVATKCLHRQTRVGLGGGLKPETDYRYRVEVDGEERAAGELWDWVPVSVAVTTSRLPDGAKTCGSVPGGTPIPHPAPNQALTT